MEHLESGVVWGILLLVGGVLLVLDALGVQIAPVQDIQRHPYPAHTGVRTPTSSPRAGDGQLPASSSSAP